MQLTWQFLNTNSIHFHHDIHIPLWREHDRTIMQQFYAGGYRDIQLAAINRCQLFLKVYSMSDNVTSDGMFIKAHICQGTPGPKVNRSGWSYQANPTLHNWQIWKEGLQHIWSDNRQMTPLGQWNEDFTSKWFYSPSEQCLLQQMDNSWLKYGRPRCLTRQHYFTIIDNLAPTSPLHSAHVSKFNVWHTQGHSTDPTPQNRWEII